MSFQSFSVNEINTWEDANNFFEELSLNEKERSEHGGRTFKIKNSNITTGQVIEVIRKVKKATIAYDTMLSKIKNRIIVIFRNVVDTDEDKKKIFSLLSIFNGSLAITSLSPVINASEKANSSKVEIEHTAKKIKTTLDRLYEDKSHRDCTVQWVEQDIKIEKEQNQVNSLDEQDNKEKSEFQINVHKVLLLTIPYFGNQIFKDFKSKIDIVYINLYQAPRNIVIGNLKLLEAVLYDQFPSEMTFGELNNFYVFCHAIQWEQGLQVCNQYLSDAKGNITFFELMHFHLSSTKHDWNEGIKFCEDRLLKLLPGFSALQLLECHLLSNEYKWKEGVKSRLLSIIKSTSVSELLQLRSLSNKKEWKEGVDACDHRLSELGTCLPELIAFYELAYKNKSKEDIEFCQNYMKVRSIQISYRNLKDYIHKDLPDFFYQFCSPRAEYRLTNTLDFSIKLYEKGQHVKQYSNIWEYVSYISLLIKLFDRPEKLRDLKKSAFREFFEYLSKDNSEIGRKLYNIFNFLSRGNKKEEALEAINNLPEIIPGLTPIGGDPKECTKEYKAKLFAMISEMRPGDFLSRLAEG